MVILTYILSVCHSLIHIFHSIRHPVSPTSTIYRSLKTAAVKEVETRYQEYELHPEKHPLYPTEWEAFWNRRYKELQAEGKDAAGHDYKPEWISFWIRHLKELFKADVEAAKRDIKIKLGLPPNRTPSRERDKKRRPSGDWSDGDRDAPKRSRRDRSPSDSSRARINRRGSRSPSRSTVHSKRRPSRSPSLDRRERIRELDRIISRLPGGSTSRGGAEYGRSDSYGYGEYDRYSSRDRERSDRYRGASIAAAYDREDSSNSPVVVIEDDDDSEPVTVVGLLRILAALEEHLGSMGTKTLDMLAKALALEKAKANSSDDVMMTDANAVFFETIKEKLKGQLITGVLNKSKINAVKKAIRKIAEILHEISKKTAEAEKKEKEKEASKRTIVIKVNMDKAMIAQRIALALVTEKKTDVTPEQLEILINVFFEMLRKSKELNKMVTTTDYIELLEEQRVKSVAESEDILGLVGKKEASPGIARKSDRPVVKLNFDLNHGEDSEELRVESAKLSQRQGPNDQEEEDDDVEEVINDKDSQATDGFSDSDLQTLLMNFKDLSSDEQQHLIRHLKRLENEAPERVEKLRKFVSFDTMDGGSRRSGGKAPLSMSEELSKRRNRWSEARPAASGGIPGLDVVPGGGNSPSASNAAASEEHDKVKFDMKKKETPIANVAALLGDDDDDDDDYSFDDVVKAASKNLATTSSGGKVTKGKEGEKAADGGSKGSKPSNGKDSERGAPGAPSKERSVSPDSKKISETHSLIANIMGSLQKKTQSAAVASSSGVVAPVPQPGTSSAPGVVAVKPNPVSSGGSGGGGSKGGAKGGGGKGNTGGGAGSLPFYQQQNNSYKSTYQEQILQQQQLQQQQQQYMQYQQQMQQQGGGYDMQQQHMMYQQGGGPNGGQWWPNQNQMFNQQQWNNGGYGGGGASNQQYPNNGQNYGGGW